MFFIVNFNIINFRIFRSRIIILVIIVCFGCKNLNLMRVYCIGFIVNIWLVIFFFFIGGSGLF